MRKLCIILCAFVALVSVKDSSAQQSYASGTVFTENFGNNATNPQTCPDGSTSGCVQQWTVTSSGQTIVTAPAGWTGKALELPSEATPIQLDAYGTFPAIPASSGVTVTFTVELSALPGSYTTIFGLRTNPGGSYETAINAHSTGLEFTSNSTECAITTGAVHTVEIVLNGASSKGYIDSVQCGAAWTDAGDVVGDIHFAGGTGFNTYFQTVTVNGSTVTGQWPPSAYMSFNGQTGNTVNAANLQAGTPCNGNAISGNSIGNWTTAAMTGVTFSFVSGTQNFASNLGCGGSTYSGTNTWLQMAVSTTTGSSGGWYTSHFTNYSTVSVGFYFKFNTTGVNVPGLDISRLAGTTGNTSYGPLMIGNTMCFENDIGAGTAPCTAALTQNTVYWLTYDITDSNDTSCSGSPCNHLWIYNVNPDGSAGSLFAELNSVGTFEPFNVANFIFSLEKNGSETMTSSANILYANPILEYANATVPLLPPLGTVASAPTFSPVAGTYTGTQSVTLSTASSGAIICYNTTGSPATNGTTGCTTGSLYSTAVSVPSSETLYAVAGGTGYEDSTVSSAAYVINPPTTHTVKPSGGDYSTIQACATGMSAGDTCTVYAGTYNEIPTLVAGTSGNYKTFNVNGSDAVYVRGFVAASYTKIVGFQIQYPSSPSSGCISIPNGTTHLYVTNNTLTECGVSGTSMINSNYPNSSSYVFVQGNTLSYACAQSGIQVSTSGTFSASSNSMTVGSVGGAQGGGTSGGWVVYGAGLNTSNGVQISSIAGLTLTLTVASGGGFATNANETNTPITLSPPECNDISAYGDHWLVENNDFSHYTLSILFLTQYGIFRNNIFHDQYQAEGSGNSHTDTMFSEPGLSVPIEYNVYEGNLQRNAFGTDAKGQLSQGESCAGTCSVLIERFNTASRVGGGIISDDSTWDAVKVYNNDWVDTLEESTFGNGNATTNNSNPNVITNTTTRSAYLNDVYYYTENGAHTGYFNAYQCSTTNGSSCSWGYNLLYCAGGCGTAYGHLYQTGTFAGETGQQIANPLFLSYIGPGSTSNDYHLQLGSPAIAAGTYLTTVAGGDSGSGASLVVTDASYFQDSYGLTNANSTVSPDCISVTTVGNHVCITAVNYSTNTLTMASGFSRSSGDHVWLYSDSQGTVRLTGSAPNIGAYPDAPCTGTCLYGSGTFSGSVVFSGGSGSSTPQAPLTYNARTDNCEQGTETGCIGGAATGKQGATLSYLGRNTDTLPSLGDPLAGSGTTITDPDFGTRICRVTDYTHFSSQSWNLGSTGQRRFNANNSLLLAQNTFAGTYIIAVTYSGSGATWACSSALTALGGSVILPGNYVFSLAQPTILYELIQGQYSPTTSVAIPPTTCTSTGCVYTNQINKLTLGCSVGTLPLCSGGNLIVASRVKVFDYNCEGASCPTSSTNQNFSGGYNAGTDSPNCLPAGWKTNWNSTLGIADDDTSITVAFGDNGQGGLPGGSCPYSPGGTCLGSVKLAVWTLNEGCRVRDSGSGLISGDYGPTGATINGQPDVITGLSNQPLPDVFSMHEGGGLSDPLLSSFTPTHSCSAPPTVNFISFTTDSSAIPTFTTAANTFYQGQQAGILHATEPWLTGAYPTITQIISPTQFKATAIAGHANYTSSTEPSSPQATIGSATSNHCQCGINGVASYCNIYYWAHDTLVAQPCGSGNQQSQCQGHSQSGQKDDFRAKLYTAFQMSNPTLPTVDANGVACGPNGCPLFSTQIPVDQHGTWPGHGLNDWSPAFLVTTNVCGQASGVTQACDAEYTAAWYDEVIAAENYVENPNAKHCAGAPCNYRFAHTGNTGTNWNFDTQNAIGDASPAQTLMVWVTDWKLGFGCLGGTAGPCLTALQATAPANESISGVAVNSDNTSAAILTVTTTGTVKFVTGQQINFNNTAEAWLNAITGPYPDYCVIQTVSSPSFTCTNTSGNLAGHANYTNASEPTSPQANAQGETCVQDQTMPCQRGDLVIGNLTTATH